MENLGGVSVTPTGIETAMKGQKTNSKDHRVYEAGAGRECKVGMRVVVLGMVVMVVVGEVC